MDRIIFVPKKDFSGTVDIPFTLELRGRNSMER